MLKKSPLPTQLSRRAFLRGAAGVAVALPALEAMIASPAHAQVALPQRYVVMFGGVSVAEQRLGTVIVPLTTGAGYTLTRPLLALETNGVKDRVAVITNLKIGWDEGSGVPPGGRGSPWHSSSLGPLLSGKRADSATDRFSPLGPTSDQVFADTLGQGSKFRSLEYKVQASGYRDESSGKRIMSYRADASPNVPNTSPRLAYESLFTGFVPVDPAEQQAALRELGRKRSVVDLVRGNAERLRARLGRADNQRIDRHFDEIRDLEARLQTVEPEVDALCQQLDASAYASDPAIVTALSGAQGLIVGYADETLRARLLADLIHMALVCDLTRVASMMITHAQSFMNCSSIVPSGVVSDIHELGHFAGQATDHGDMLNWHVDKWAYLVRKLQDTPEGNGTLLDRTALALVFEGGLGFDPESGGANSPHSSENMAMLVAGAGMQGGLHIDGGSAHPAQGLLACGRAVGYAGTLGDISTALAGV